MVKILLNSDNSTNFYLINSDPDTNISISDVNDHQEKIAVCGIYKNANCNRIFPDLSASAPCYPLNIYNDHLWGNFDKDMESRIKRLEETIIKERPCNRWEYIVGAELTKSRLIDHVFKPALLTYTTTSKINSSSGIPGNVLLHGPPGCGKTFLCNTLAGELVGVGKTTLIAISPFDIFGNTVKDGIENVKALFELGRRNSPCIIIIDDMEEMLSKCEENIYGNINEQIKISIIETFLEQMYFFSPERNLGVTVLGTTTYPWKLDDKILRYFDNIWPVPYPNEIERIISFKKCLIQQKITNTLTNGHFSEIAKRLKRFAYSDIFHLSCDIWKMQWKNLTFTNRYKQVRGITPINGKTFTNVSTMEGLHETTYTPKGWKFIGIEITCQPVGWEEVLACLNSRTPSRRDGVPPMWATDELEMEYSIREEKRVVKCSTQFKDCALGFWNMLGTAFMYLLSQI